MKLKNQEAALRSSSLKMVLEQGILSPHKYRDNLIHQWYLDEQYNKYLHTYFLARELSVELKRNIHDGTLKVGKYTYNGIWINKPETIYKSDQALLSFRYCKYLECGYVLIKKYDPKGLTLNMIGMLDYKRNYDEGISNI